MVICGQQRMSDTSEAILHAVPTSHFLPTFPSSLSFPVLSVGCVKGS